MWLTRLQGKRSGFGRAEGDGYQKEIVSRKRVMVEASIIAVLLCFLVFNGSAAAQTRVQDIFGRSLNQHGITLVDWDGYMANPLIRFCLLPPTNAALPGSATLSANGARLYFSNQAVSAPTARPRNVP